MKLIVNGEQKEFQDGTTLQSLIDFLQIESKVMAAAVNMQVVKKEQWKSYELKDSDTLELLQFVGGG